MSKTAIAKRLHIKGVVQGVGFRPFLFNLALQHNITGRVSNTRDGVTLHVEGRQKNLDAYCNALAEKCPPLAIIKEIQKQDTKIQGFKSFKIEKSLDFGTPNTLISPDVSICKDCLEEMQDPENRRFEYPFINCTNCGPRFTIIEDIPYDRPKTSMKNFQMCRPCHKEYNNPLDRRFHAQPNACPDCGPHLFLVDNKGRVAAPEGNPSITATADFLSQGKIIGIKGLGGFHLACDAKNKAAVTALRKKKQRPEKPFALMARNPDAVKKWVHISKNETKTLTSHQRPIVLLKKRDNAETDAPFLSAISPDNSCLGIMLPYTPMHFLLLERGPDLLVMTSGNRSGDPLSIDNQDALDTFCHIADFFLLHNRDIYFRSDDSIVRWQSGKLRFIRRSRGYAPLPITVENSLPEILACGAGLKNTICLARKKDIFLSQHIGNLDTIKSHDYFKQSIQHMGRIFDVQPKIIAHDLHPGYMSTQYAFKNTIPKKISIQHHHAHAVACMGEHGLDETVVAIVLDGTGLGTDGHIWGGEVLICDRSNFKRWGHLVYTPMPGGDMAATQPWRMAVSFLHRALGPDLFELDVPPFSQKDPAVIKTIIQMIEKKINCPLTSSAGRLFDAVASLTGICHTMTYESQAAMALEAAALKNGSAAFDISGDVYDFNIFLDGRIDMTPCIRQILFDVKKHRPIETVSLIFHRTIARAFSTAAARACLPNNKIVLSGGVFNNDILLSHMIQFLEKKGFNVFSHTKVPTGDGGICLGQILAAAAMEEKN